MLGLLLVVTMLGNYLANQLPAQMQVNDANHGLQVENQLARLTSTLRQVAEAGAVGGVVSQPISLGSLGDPPFAGADGSTIGPETRGSQLTVSYTVTGSSTYSPPSVGPAGGRHYSACSSQTSTTLTCSAAGTVVWNFSAATPSSLSMTTSGGPYYVNTSASNTTLGVTASAALTLYLLVIGSNDTVTLTLSASGNAVHVEMVGNHDTVSIAAGSLTSTKLTVYFVGNYDELESTSLSATSSHLIVTAYGSYDNTSLGTVSATSSYFNVYLNGFVPHSPSANCPVGNLAYDTDSVAVGTHSGGTYNVTYNDTTVTSGSAPSPWTGTFGTPSISCPFYSTAVIPQTTSGAVGAAFVVQLHNTYTPIQVLAFDQGALVYAQPNSDPFLLIGPDLNYTSGALQVRVSEFTTAVGIEEGIGTAQFAARLVSLLNITLPSSSFSLSGAVSVKVVTPYAAAWYDYLTHSDPSVAGDVICLPATSATCTGPFTLSGSLGTIYVNVTATSLDLQVATYAVSLI